MIVIQEYDTGSPSVTLQGIEGAQKFTRKSTRKVQKTPVPDSAPVIVPLGRQPWVVTLQGVITTKTTVDNLQSLYEDYSHVKLYVETFKGVELNYAEAYFTGCNIKESADKVGTWTYELQFLLVV